MLYHIGTVYHPDGRKNIVDNIQIFQKYFRFPSRYNDTCAWTPNKVFINFLLVSVETACVLLQSWWARLSTGASREAWMAYTIAQYVRSRMLAHYSHVCYCFFRVIVLVVVVVVCVFGDNVEMALYDKF